MHTYKADVGEMLEKNVREASRKRKAEKGIP